MQDHTIQVECRQTDRWVCQVQVGDDAGATSHSVEVPSDCMQRLIPDADDPHRLVEESFRFLLEREPRESIMSRFALPIITRFFPEWESEMQRRLR